MSIPNLIFFCFDKFKIRMFNVTLQLQEHITNLKKSNESDQIAEYQEIIKKLKIENEDKKSKYLMLNNKSREDLNKIKSMLNQKIEKLERELEDYRLQENDFGERLRAAEASYMQRISMSE